MILGLSRVDPSARPYVDTDRSLPHSFTRPQPVQCVPQKVANVRTGINYHNMSNLLRSAKDLHYDVSLVGCWDTFYSRWARVCSGRHLAFLTLVKEKAYRMDARS